jgi:SAM-dependent methyltransferase
LYYESLPQSNNVGRAVPIGLERTFAILKVESANVATSLPGCRLCGASTRPAMDKDSFSIVRCERCEFMFAIVPPAINTENIYSDDQFFFSPEVRDGERSDTWYDVLWRLKRPFYLARLSRIANFQKPGRILDIGCAAGYMLDAARQLGWEIAGVEPSPSMRERTRAKLNCTVYESLDEAAAVTGQRFDCIMMFEVIEHLEDPIAVMKKISELLVPGGLIALSTPNCQSPGAIAGLPLNIWFAPPAHISYFGPTTLVSCLRQAGFDPLVLDGLEGFCRVLAGDILLPRWLTTILGPMRRGKRLRPHGAIGKLLVKLYASRLNLYQRRTPAGVSRSDILEFYARRAD